MQKHIEYTHGVQELNAIKSSILYTSEGETCLNSFGETHSDEGLTLETSAFKLFTLANFRYQLS